jgi:hypothetical protein
MGYPKRASQQIADLGDGIKSQPMTSIANFFSQHPYWATAILTWISNYGISAFTSALDAPTATSSPYYRFFFKFVTAILAQNPSRARNVSVESSPNFQAAVTKQTDLAGVAPITVVAVPKP